MRLVSITVRNYRLHRELEVAFDPSRTVIGGPNEAGKSTLVEAAHRALFLRAKITGKIQKSMVSSLHGGQPEVELSFACGGETYRIAKRFSGSTGTSTLLEPSGVALHGDEAETRLSEILGVDSAGGKTAAGRVPDHWAHLWVWQGKAGDNPTEHANSERDSLLGRLQQTGGAAMMQSELDARVAARVASAHDSIFTKNDTAKKDSDLARAMEADLSATVALEEARATLDKLRSALRDLEEAQVAIEAGKNGLPPLETQKSEIDKKLARANELHAAGQMQKLAADTAARSHADLFAGHNQIEDIRRQVATASSKLARTAETERLQRREAETRQQQEAEKQHQAAAETVRQARLQYEHARAHVALFEKSAIRDNLRARFAQIQELQKQQAALQAARAKVPGITPAALQSLHALESKCATAAAAIKAMAATIEVVTSDGPVRIGSKTLNAGETELLTDEAELTIGPGTRLRIRPGGGTTLTQARQHLQDLQEQLRGALGSHGVATTAEAVEAATRSQNVDADLRAIATRLSDLGAASIERDLSQADATCTVAAEEVRRRASLTSQLLGPADAADAAHLMREGEKQLRAAEETDRTARSARDAAVRAATEAADALNRHRQAMRQEQESLARLQGQLSLLLARYGEDDVRAAKLAEAQTAKDSTSEMLAATRRSLADLRPDALVPERNRLESTVNAMRAAKNQAEQKRGVAQALLQSDGASDPQSALSVAEVRMRSASEQLVTVRRRAEAIRLLHRLFDEEQSNLANRFSAPLAERISGYLQCLFGPETRALVRLDEGAFSALEITRPGQAATAFDFDSLSGGTREQVAAAARLAMAEVLAESHHGCLPVVFDDAFAYSDPPRVRTLQRMLDRAANRGLQVIVFTCNPSDYAELHAKEVLIGSTTVPALPSVTATAVTVAALPPTVSRTQPAATPAEPPVQNPIAVTTDNVSSARALAGITVTDTQRQALVAALQAGGGSMRSSALRESLNWDVKTYDAVKQDLLASGRLVSARGRNATVTLADQLLL